MPLQILVRPNAKAFLASLERPVDTLAPPHPRIASILQGGVGDVIPFNPLCTRRSDRLTATDIPVLTRQNKYVSIALWQLKKLGLHRVPCTAAMQHGINHEKAALEAFTVGTGHPVITPIGFIAPHDSIFGATPDALLRYYPVNVEVKCPFFSGNVKTGIPEIYYGQLQAQMQVTRLSHSLLLRYFPATDFSDERLYIDYCAKNDEWWESHLPTFFLAHQTLHEMQTGARPYPPLPDKALKHRKRLHKFARFI